MHERNGVMPVVLHSCCNEDRKSKKGCGINSCSHHLNTTLEEMRVVRHIGASRQVIMGLSTAFLITWGACG